MQNNNRTPNPLDHLYDIVNDLWGTPVEEAAPAADKPKQTTPVYQQTFPPFEQFWKVADETVDWTEALAHDRVSDGLTSPQMWSFFHEHAQRVLNGDISAYVEVLKAANPLGDLLPYARGFNVKAESADRLSVSFDGLPSYLNQKDSERKRYLAGICLRAARDLMALLPVCETSVIAMENGKPLLDVTFTRQELQKVRFSFVDPVQFAIACGGKYAE